MTDTVFNLIIILIPVAIIVGRMVVNARNKRHPPPAPAQPRIPVHFEDDDDSYFKKQASARQPETKTRVQTSSTSLATRVPNEAFPAAASGVKPTPAPGKTVAAAPSGHKDFTLNLSHLSPLKQAVVMAEILGPPKAME